MGRAPCCEKIGLKKGPWSPEEDHILIDYINTCGHPNWRALPKHAGLLRCGKSCRLRWINYLRPDIKRGNFTPEEEDAIINLHEMLGNRWSAIATRLPGRTDNEIKNVWHTHLKKRLPQYQKNHQHTKPRNPKPMESMDVKQEEQHPVVFTKGPETTEDGPQCSSYMSTLTNTSTTEHSSSIGITTNTATNHDRFINNNVASPDQNNLELDDDFWSEVLSADNSGEPSDFPVIGAADQRQFQFSFSPLLLTEEEGIHVASSLSTCRDSIDFWYDIYMRAQE